MSGSSAFALSFDSKSSTATRVELGLWLDKLINLSQGEAIALRGRAAWAHDHSGSPSAAFQTLPGTSFTVNGAEAATAVILRNVADVLRFNETFREYLPGEKVTRTCIGGIPNCPGVNVQIDCIAMFD